MYVDDGGQIPRQRLPNGPIDALSVVLACADQRMGMRTELNPASFIKRK